MAAMTSARHDRNGRRRRRSAAPRRRITVSGVLGELLVTLGVTLLLFLGWKYWLNDIITGNEEIAASTQLSERLAEEAESADPVEADERGVPIRPIPQQTAQEFAVMYVPAFGDDWSRRIAADVDRPAVLDQYFIGAYMDSDPVGSVGNFVVAGHRIGAGSPMGQQPDLQFGDRVYIETVDGWYVYEYRSAEYVLPNEVSVLAPVPRHPELPASERVMVLLTCNPLFSVDERLITYTTLVEFVPRADGPPEEIEAAFDARSDGQDHGGDL